MNALSLGSPHLERPRSDGARLPRRGLLERARPAARWLIRRRYDVRVHHPERFPATGPAVVAGNHIGFIDGPLMAIFAPRPVHALTKQEMFTGALGAFLRASGQIRLDRARTDPAAVRVALRVLRDGGCVGVFPEGTRGPGDLEVFHSGAAYLALVTGAPVVPLTFLGSRDPGGTSGSLPSRGARIDIVVGEPVAVDAVSWPRTRDHVRLTSAALRDHMQVGLAGAMDETGRSLPGPLPQGESHE
ncbi:lysophospholipid acyltransferase family protein [Nocardioides caeni]|uniref:1-acyl-sn-glycerol-3-phosphate acyltransferase n=1 Tax=Nocardioides caeni TaxID=574700 RepID=A0A4V4HJ78_9ACTN|nr:lysophospholipid acyltransferase family protein [Nocardioides caeni]THV09456.1 1-acyl-sn-glycerol-3-phosphate acyltransferase [Nocardioides caeni]